MTARGADWIILTICVLVVIGFTVFGIRSVQGDYDHHHYSGHECSVRSHG